MTHQPTAAATRPPDDGEGPRAHDVVHEAPVDADTDGPAEAAALKRARAETVGRYVAMFAMPLVMVSMMISGYLGTMHAPTPHDMPIVVSGTAPEARQLVDSLESALADAVEVRVVDSDDEARRLVLDRDVPGAVHVVDGRATVYTASSAGASQSSTVTGMLAPQILSQGLTLQTEDLAPLPAFDPAGLGAMFLATALVMAGYLPFSVVLSNSPELLPFRRAVPLLAAWSALIAALVWTVTGPLLGVVQGHTAQVLGIAWLGVFAIGSVQLFLTRVLGPMAVLAAMLFLTVLGMPASNMSMSIHTMPGFFTYLHTVLPTPAIGEALRSVLYFDGAGVWSYLLVLVVGALVGLALTLWIDARRRRRDPRAAAPQVTMPSLHGGPRPRTRRWRYASLLFFPLAMVTMMISVMLGAMSAPAPRDMPVAVVGSTLAQARDAVDGLDEHMPGLFDLRAVDSVERARTQVQDRTVSAAFVLPSAEHPQATLVTNQAAGTSAKQVVTAVFGQVSASGGTELVTEEVAPLSTSDTMGSVSMYIAMGWILSGFLIIVVGANAAPSSRPLRRLVPIVAGWSAFMSAVLWLIAGPITGSISGHFWPLLGTGAVAIFCVAMFSAVLERLVGMLAVVPAVGILMLVGIPASGGGLSIYLEPVIFRALHEVLPMPAAVESVRSILYFGGDTVASHLATFGVWGAVSLVLVMIIDKVKPLRSAPATDGPDVVETEPARERALV